MAIESLNNEVVAGEDRLATCGRTAHRVSVEVGRDSRIAERTYVSGDARDGETEAKEAEKSEIAVREGGEGSRGDRSKKAGYVRAV